MKKDLVHCPTCEKAGRKEILGEVDKDGNFVVLRFHGKTTKIVSNDYTVICGVCGHKVFYRKSWNNILR